MKPREILVLGFAALILLGALLLMLPCATVSEGGLDFLSALFTSTSAVCVTGLTVVNTGLTFTVFGKIVILCLIQIGGLGLMTVASLLFLMIGKRISLRERLVIQESFNTESMQDLLRLVRWAIAITLSCELIGAALLAVRFVPQFGWSRGCFHAVFTSISAFCNAGFDLLGQANSIESLATDPFVLCVIMALIVLGGLGFAVILDVIRYRRNKRLMLHTRLVLFSSLVLLVVGAGLTALLEWNNPLTLGQDGFSVGDKIVNALFQSVTWRTAGFDTIGQGELTAASVLLGVIWMFIGASPASTGGGAKTTTVFAVLLLIWSTVRRRQDHNVGKRRLPDALVKKALAVFALMLVLLLCGTLIVCTAEQMNGNDLTLSQVLYETVSASATVGLSTGITAGLHGVSKVVLILLMFFGRLGPLTISMALSGEASKANALRYPEDHIMIG